MAKPTRAVRKVIIQGVAHYSINDTAKMLNMSVHQVRKLMGDGKLEYRQTRLNSRQLYVSGDSIIRVKYPPA